MINKFYVYRYTCPKTFASIKEAARWLNTSNSNVKAQLVGKLKTVKKHTFEFI